MWSLETLNALNSAAVKVGERKAFAEVGITSLADQLIVLPTDDEKSKMVKEMLGELLFANE